MAYELKFPETLYVKIEKLADDGEPFFTSFETQYGLAEHGETVQIATYRLVRIEEVELKLEVKGEIK